MTERATITCDEFLDLAAAVALDATDLEDARRVEDHAAACPECGKELRRFREAAAALGAVVSQAEPPAELRARVLEAISHEPRPLLRRLWPRALRRSRPSAAWLVAAASMLVSIAALGWVAVLEGQISDLQKSVMLASDHASRYDHVVQVLASDRLAIRPLQPVVQSMPSRGMVYMDPSTGTGMLLCHDLPPIEQGHAYQVWFSRGNERVSGGMLWPDHSGNGYTIIQVPADLQSFDAIGLTDEPGNGSAWPTTPRVIGTPLKETSQ
jgi:hypothetical protein